MDATVILLAGGKSTRMGQDKGLLELEGKPMIQHVIDRAKTLQLPILIVANNTEYAQFGLPVFADEIENKGPLGGIYTGLLHSSTALNLVISCDAPYVSLELMKHLLETAQENRMEITVPKYGQLHPLIAVYHRNVLNRIKSAIDEHDLKVLNMLNRAKTGILDLTNRFSGREFSNINEKKDLKN